MENYQSRKGGFNTREVHSVREAYAGFAREYPGVKLEMRVDGHRLVTGGNFFRFATARYGIELCPGVAGGKRACRVVVRDYANRCELLDKVDMRPAQDAFLSAALEVMRLESLA